MIRARSLIPGRPSKPRYVHIETYDVYRPIAKAGEATVLAYRLRVHGNFDDVLAKLVLVIPLLGNDRQ